MLETILVAMFLAFGSILPIIYDGLERKVRAALQSRIGPPITQTLYDVVKLFHKESKPVNTYPYVAYAVVTSILLLTASLTGLALLALTGDYATYLTLTIITLMVAHTSQTIAPLLIPSPFSQIGGAREVVLSLVNESTLLVSVGIYLATSPKTLNRPLDPALAIGVAIVLTMLAISTYVATGRTPFDIAEAEPELASGTIVELSGPLLALHIYSTLMKRLVVKTLFVLLALMLFVAPGPLLLALAFISIPVAWLAYSIPAVLLGRSRIDLAPRTLVKIYLVLLALSITELLLVM